MNTKKFCDLKCGEKFSCNGLQFIKTNVSFNAVCLDDGSTQFFNSCEFVVRMDAVCTEKKLTIKDLTVGEKFKFKGGFTGTVYTKIACSKDNSINAIYSNCVVAISEDTEVVRV